MAKRRREVNEEALEKGLQEMMEFRTQQIEQGGMLEWPTSLKLFDQEEAVARRYIDIAPYRKRVRDHIGPEWVEHFYGPQKLAA